MTSIVKQSIVIDIRYILDRYPDRHTVGWWPLIHARNGDIWDAAIFIVRLPYGLCYVSACQLRLYPHHGFIMSRFLYHRGLNVAIGGANIADCYVGGWDRVIDREHLADVVADPMMIRMMTGLPTAILRHDKPFLQEIDSNDPRSERRLMDAWGHKIRCAVIIHIWEDFLIMRSIVKVQRFWRNRRYLRRVNRLPQGMKALCSQYLTGTIGVDQYRELLRSHLQTLK